MPPLTGRPAGESVLERRRCAVPHQGVLRLSAVLDHTLLFVEGLFL